ncbi:glycine--tRNA ligase subunit beta [Planctobacterium marinum]|uniref:Glycine--tRNA ligase beta subunit n=1 Tax=Planctobacterium marinum TaxID=1631968 RepID=A0AA48I223_9ALTE|nr:glycine--tRNA ligase beta subunit [Planctobacterium marinum]
MSNNLVIELACEELPPKALRTLGQTFQSNIVDGLKQARFTFQSTQWFATPRRLSLLISGLSEKQEDIELVKKGPPVKSAYDASGEPTKAALGWAKSNNITLEEATVVETPKGEWLQVTIQETGKNIDSCLQNILDTSASKLPVPKVMRWGDSDHQFVRPVHNLCCLFNDKVIPVELFGKKANNLVMGHRFHSPGLHELHSAESYESQLNSLNVIADFEKRKANIVQSLNQTAVQFNGKVVEDDDLVEEVTSLVEYPVVLSAEFDESFLNVPKEPLIYTMKDDQRYFPLLSNNDGKLLNRFLFVSNISSNNPDTVISGNEKVVRPRLADAKFFYEYDLSVATETRLDSLKSIVYQKQLGTLFEKSERVANLSRALTQKLQIGDPELCYRAGLLAKSDLTSKVVYEFPDVQGYMGQCYALNDGEVSEVATAIADHYKPRSASDSLPASDTAKIVSIAERLDTLTGIFGIGILPKGDKDPFALRRATLGIIKVVLENDINLDFKALLNLSAGFYAQGTLNNQDWQEQLIQFFNARLENFFIEQGHQVNTVRSVIEVAGNSIETIKYRLEALTNFIENNRDTMAILSESNKRIANILAKNNAGTTKVDASLFVEEEEKVLWAGLNEISTESTMSLSAEAYSDRLNELASLRTPIATFFDKVMVNADDEAIKQNRFALIATIRSVFLSVADISLLQG